MMALLAVIGLLWSAPPALEVAVAARALQPGELVVLTMRVDGASSVQVKVFGRDIPAFKKSEGTWVALFGIDLDQKPGPYTAAVAAQVGPTTVRATQPLAVRAKAFPTRSLRVDPSFVNPSPDELARISADATLIRDAYAGSSTDRLWSDAFVRPVPDAANSRFGTRSIFNGAPRSPHGGTDFLSPTGTPVGAPNAGRVVVARDLYFTGQTVIIDHGLGVLSLLAHLSRVDVHEGERIAAGQVVGLVGATGRVTGPHLHWALRVAGARVDALSVLALLGRY